MNCGQIDWTATGTMVLAIVTFILAGATIWLAITTRDMAKVSKDAFLLECRPYCIFQNFIFKFYIEKKVLASTETDRTFLKIGLVFKNSGKVAVVYRVESIRVAFGGRTLENAPFNNRGSLIAPGDTTVFWHPPIPDVTFNQFPTEGVVEFEIGFQSLDSVGTYKSKRKIQFLINTVVPPGDHDWTYLEESDTAPLKASA
jgi:hypothetical protein